MTTDAQVHQYQLGLLLGDGIGPEIVPVTAEVVDSVLTGTRVSVQWRQLPFGRAAIAEHGHAVPQATLDTLGELDGWLAGPHDNVSYPEPHRSALSPSGVLRKHFDLFANVRPARAVCGPCGGMDLVFVRENTEGLYSDRNAFRGSGEWMPTSDVALTTGVFTRFAVQRIVRQAFELAQQRRRHLTVVHKGNVMPLTMGMFRDVTYEMAPQFPDVEVDDVLVDAMAAHLVRDARRFDVIVTENMLGDILSDLAGELTGSLGRAGSLNTSTQAAMAQAAHGSAPDIASQGIADPIGMISSAAMLLEWLSARAIDRDLGDAAAKIRSGVDRVVEEADARQDQTRSTASMAGAVAEYATT